ncbi:MAG TPA: hypothetical protein VFW96_02795 [Thermomicrobiales bacterium]|nr:hypothetical protein [Thermomicrobiales bacterium]
MSARTAPSSDQTATEAVETMAAQTPMQAGFDPAKYLVKINNRGDYLEVKWRLLWLRTEHPAAVIETELMRFEQDEAVFRARVSVPGGGVATGWGSETSGDFRDYLEKAETKAIGRALAALGYGTQFCQDHEFGATGGWVVDAPVDINGTRGRAGRGDGRQAARAADGRAAGNAASAAQLQQATERQLKFIYAIAREAGLDDQELASWSQELYGAEVDQLTRRDASALIEALQRRRNEVA